jgi:HEAT repeat protein
MLPALAAVALLFAAPAARADRLVVYIQEQMGRTPALVPLLARVRAGTTLVDRVSALFARLRREKPHVYGRAALDLGSERATELERSKIVTVELDPDRPRTRDEVIAEVVYTFTEAGAKAVRAGVRGETARIYTRDDIGVPAFVLTVPLWLGLPPAAHAGALVRLPGGELISVVDVEKRLRQGQPALAEALTLLLKEGDLERRLRAVRAFGYLPEGLARAKLLELLRDPDARLRAAAVDGLSAQPSPEVTSALERLLADEGDEEVRSAAARALMQSGAPQAAQQGIAYLLKSPDSARKVALLRGLKGAELAGLVDALLPVLSDRSAEVREAALQALTGRAEPKLLEAAASLVDKDADARVRGQAARMLIQSGESRYIARGLAFELTSKNEERALAAAQQLGGLGNDGREVLESALEKSTGAVRRAVAEALLRIGDPRSLPALAHAARQGSRMAEKAAAAVLAKLTPVELAKLIEAGDGRLKRLALAAAAGASGPEVQPALIAATRDKDRLVRASAAEALAKGSGEAVAALASLLEDEDDRVRKAAADSLGAIGSPEARPALLKLAKYGNVKVREAVFRALGLLKGTPPREVIAQLLDALYDENAAVREGALAALSQADKKDRRIVPVVRLQLKDGAAGVRRAAVRALGMLGDAAVVSALEDALTDAAAEVRLAAVDALERVGGAAVADILEKHASVEKEPTIAARAREAATKAKGN